MYNRLKDFSLSEILDQLKDVDNMPLFNLLCGETRREDGNRGRRNPSFASKFCHYACFHLFEGLPEQDSYSIYDNVIRKVLHRYAEKYNVKHGNLADYRNYRKTIDEIIKASGSNISRNGFDHLLWYYHKGR